MFVSLFLYYLVGGLSFYVRDANFGVHPCIQTAARHSLIFICARACSAPQHPCRVHMVHAMKVKVKVIKTNV